MATIPKAIDFSGQRRIATINTSGIGAAFESVARTLKDFDSSRERYQISKAKSHFLTLKAEQDNAYENDENYKTYEERYSKAIEDGLKGISEGIDNERARSFFLDEIRPSIERGRQTIIGKAFTREKDTERGDTFVLLKGVREAGLTGGEEDVREAVQNARDIYESGRDSGYFTNQEVQVGISEFQNSLAEGRLNMMAPKDRLEATKLPWFKNLPADKRAVLKRQFTDDAMQSKAIDVVDEYEGMTKIDALTKIGDIKDPKLRKIVEQRYAYQFNLKRDAESEQERDLYSKYFLPIRTGEMNFNEIEQADLKTMTPQQLNNLLIAQTNSVKPTRTTSDRKLKDTLNLALAEGRNLDARELLNANHSKLNDSDFSKFSVLTTKGVNPETVNGHLSDEKFINLNMDKANINDDDDRNQIHLEFNTWLTSIVEQTKKEPNVKEKLEAFDRIIFEVDEQKSFGWGAITWLSRTKLIDISDEEKKEKLLELRAQNTEFYDAVLQEYINAGKTPTYEELVGEFNAPNP